MNQVLLSKSKIRSRVGRWLTYAADHPDRYPVSSLTVDLLSTSPPEVYNSTPERSPPPPQLSTAALHTTTTAAPPPSTPEYADETEKDETEEDETDKDCPAVNAKCSVQNTPRKSEGVLAPVNQKDSPKKSLGSSNSLNDFINDEPKIGQAASKRPKEISPQWTPSAATNRQFDLLDSFDDDQNDSQPAHKDEPQDNASQDQAPPNRTSQEAPLPHHASQDPPLLDQAPAEDRICDSINVLSDDSDSDEGLSIESDVFEQPPRQAWELSIKPDDLPPPSPPSISENESAHRGEALGTMHEANSSDTQGERSEQIIQPPHEQNQKSAENESGELEEPVSKISGPLFHSVENTDEFSQDVSLESSSAGGFNATLEKTSEEESVPDLSSSAPAVSPKIAPSASQPKAEESTSPAPLPDNHRIDGAQVERTEEGKPPQEIFEPPLQLAEEISEEKLTQECEADPEIGLSEKASSSEEVSEEELPELKAMIENALACPNNLKFIQTFLDLLNGDGEKNLDRRDQLQGFLTSWLDGWFAMVNGTEESSQNLRKLESLWTQFKGTEDLKKVTEKILENLKESTADSALKAQRELKEESSAERESDDDELELGDESEPGELKPSALEQPPFSVVERNPQKKIRPRKVEAQAQVQFRRKTSIIGGLLKFVRRCMRAILVAFISGLSLICLAAWLVVRLDLFKDLQASVLREVAAYPEFTSLLPFEIPEPTAVIEPAPIPDTAPIPEPTPIPEEPTPALQPAEPSVSCDCSHVQVVPEIPPPQISHREEEYVFEIPEFEEPDFDQFIDYEFFEIHELEEDGSFYGQV